MTLSERLCFRLSALWAAVLIGPSAIPVAWRMSPVAGGSDEDAGGDPAPAGDDGGEDSGDGADDGDDFGEVELDVDRARESVKKANDQAAAYRIRAREAEEKVRQYEDANKTEKDKLTEAKDSAAQEAAESKAEVLRLKMAIKYGLSEDDLDLLGTGDEETIESRAKRLQELSKGQVPDKSSRTPRERLRPGAVPSAEAEETNPDKLAAKVPRLY